MNKIKFVLRLAISIALAFTFGCSSDDSGGKSSEKCGDDSYNIAKQFCYNGIVYDYCNNAYFFPYLEFCYDGILYPQCYSEDGNQIIDYNPLTHGCVNNKIVETKCGAGWYDQEFQFCYDGILYMKCGSSDYDPPTQGCCNSSFYDLLTQRCSSYEECRGLSCSYLKQENRCLCVNNNDGKLISSFPNTFYKLETKCGENWYNQNQEFCIDNKVYQKCDGNDYDPLTQRCNYKTVENKCGEENWYNAENANLRCENDVVEIKCGNNWYSAYDNKFTCQGIGE